MAAALCGLLLASCERVNLDEESSMTGNLIVKVNGIESGYDATRTLTNVTEVCSRLCFALYKDGERVKYENQKVGDKNYGTVSFTVDPGEYEMLIVGHNGERNPSTTHPEKIQFSNLTASGGTGFTDTFYHYEVITVSDDAKTGEVILQRATALVQIVTTDVKPSKIQKVYFRYTGGSGALDATTGTGCVKSNQVIIFETGQEWDGKTMTFNLFTFPREDSETLEITINVIDSKEETVVERVLENVPVKRNEISRYKGELFTGSGTDTPTPPTPSKDSQSTSFKVETDWGAIHDYTF